MNLIFMKCFYSFRSFFSGGILCDAVGILCGGTIATDVGGAIYREGHTFVLTHGVTANNVAGSVGKDYVLLLFSQSFFHERKDSQNADFFFKTSILE
jgi:hypothetical protein